MGSNYLGKDDRLLKKKAKEKDLNFGSRNVGRIIKALQ